MTTQRHRHCGCSEAERAADTDEWVRLADICLCTLCPPRKDPTMTDLTPEADPLMLDFERAANVLRDASWNIPRLRNGGRPDPLPGLPEARDLLTELRGLGYGVVSVRTSEGERAADTDEWVRTAPNSSQEPAPAAMRAETRPESHPCDSQAVSGDSRLAAIKADLARHGGTTVGHDDALWLLAQVESLTDLLAQRSAALDRVVAERDEAVAWRKEAIRIHGARVDRLQLDLDRAVDKWIAAEADKWAKRAASNYRAQEAADVLAEELDRPERISRNLATEVVKAAMAAARPIILRETADTWAARGDDHDSADAAAILHAAAALAYTEAGRAVEAETTGEK